CLCSLYSYYCRDWCAICFSTRRKSSNRWSFGNDCRLLWYVTNPYGWKFQRFTCSIIREDRKSTRLNSSHVSISYAVFCLKKNRDEPNVQLGSTDSTHEEHYG